MMGSGRAKPGIFIRRIPKIAIPLKLSRITIRSVRGVGEARLASSPGLKFMTVGFGGNRKNWQEQDHRLQEEGCNKYK